MIPGKKVYRGKHCTYRFWALHHQTPTGALAPGPARGLPSPGTFPIPKVLNSRNGFSLGVYNYRHDRHHHYVIKRQCNYSQRHVKCPITYVNKL